DRRLMEWLHPLCRFVFAVALEQAFRRPNVTTVARILACSARQLERRFDSAGLPPPHRLITLARWIPIADALARRSPSTKALSFALGFSSTQAFCRAAHRELRMSVTDLRCSDGRALIIHDLMTAYQDPTGGRSASHNG
ncbi:MAG TPA: helix-turn-helix domain-containing protein, partial [Gemmatimonadaceae bacterium]